MIRTDYGDVDWGALIGDIGTITTGVAQIVTGGGAKAPATQTVTPGYGTPKPAAAPPAAVGMSPLIYVAGGVAVVALLLAVMPRGRR